ncbi:MAG: hypothetical protein ABL908_18875, partial [Hyphomicrobium sp.]
EQFGLSPFLKRQLPRPDCIVSGENQLFTGRKSIDDRPVLGLPLPFRNIRGPKRRRMMPRVRHY